MTISMRVHQDGKTKATRVRYGAAIRETPTTHPPLRTGVAFEEKYRRPQESVKGRGTIFLCHLAQHLGRSWRFDRPNTTLSLETGIDLLQTRQQPLAVGDLDGQTWTGVGLQQHRPSAGIDDDIDADVSQANGFRDAPRQADHLV